jgi:hypothetical protein
MRRLARYGHAGLRIIFHDEYSQVSEAHLSAISLRCQRCSGDTGMKFGKYHMVFVGDARQHTPTNGFALTHDATATAGATLGDSDDECDADADDDEPRPSATGETGPDMMSQNADGRAAFLSLTTVVTLNKQQRAHDTPSGLQLRAYAELFMGTTAASLDDVTEFCDAFNAKYHECDVTDVMHREPRVVTQRQKARAIINLHLSLRIAASLGRRAIVWVSRHSASRDFVPPVCDALQQALLRRAVGRVAEYCPSVFVFFEVRWFVAMRLIVRRVVWILGGVVARFSGRRAAPVDPLIHCVFAHGVARLPVECRVRGTRSRRRCRSAPGP